MQRLLRATKKVAGIKQTRKAVEKGLAGLVYIAGDADEKIRRPLLDLCRTKGIAVVEVDSMNDLGKSCGIQVNTAAAAILEQV